MGKGGEELQGHGAASPLGQPRRSPGTQLLRGERVQGSWGAKEEDWGAARGWFWGAGCALVSATGMVVLGVGA